MRCKGWHVVGMNQDTENEKYYFHSFIYRFLVFFYWCNKIEKQLECIDTTMATNKETRFLMLLKSMKLVFCDAELFNDDDYDRRCEKDHFFKNKFETYINFVESGDDVLKYDEYLKKVEEDTDTLLPWFDYISDIGLKGIIDNNYNVIICFHILLVSFLNVYGYNFQKTSIKKYNR
jgi:hypothetical protein